MRDLGIDHLTVLDLHPVDFIHAAAEARFASVSIRSIHILGGVPRWGEEPLDTDAVRHALNGAGIGLHAVEAVALTADLGERLEELRPLLQQGAELGARLVYSFADDPEPQRCADSFALLADVAAEFGMRAVIEPMPYRSVATLTQAAGIVDGIADAGVVVDTLHASRGGTVPADLAQLDPSLLTVLQLCDAPATAPLAPSSSGLHPLLHEARFERLLPGEGDLPLADFVAVMPEDVVVTVEAPAPRREATAAQRLQHVIQATRVALGEASDGGTER